MKEHSLLKAFNTHLNTAFPFLAERRKVQLILAISGGMDSVVLSELLRLSGFETLWAHCNFHLRGAESDRDESFVRELAASRNQPLLVKSFQTNEMADHWKMSIEETARKLRYDWFKVLLDTPELLSSEDAERVSVAEAVSLPAFAKKDLPKGNLLNRYLVTAHHANDHIETLLLNFFRGCGIAGLHGIPAHNGSILRPLLVFKRESLLSFAQDNNLKWMEDSTNQSIDYTRNFFRQEMIPAIKVYFPQVEDNLLDNIRRFSEVELLYTESIEKYKKRLIVKKGKDCLLSVRLLLKTGFARTLLWELLKNYGFGQRQIPEVEKLLSATTGAYQDSTNYRIFKNRAHLVLTPLKAVESASILITESDLEISYASGVLKISRPGDFKLDKDPTVANLDLKDIRFPLLLRKWQQGDYFYPLGMRKKKKLSRFFIDQKLSLAEKEQIWVLESDQRIIWIIGLRMDDRFKITQATKNILKLKLHTTNDCPN